MAPEGAIGWKEKNQLVPVVPVVPVVELSDAALTATATTTAPTTTAVTVTVPTAAPGGGVWAQADEADNARAVTAENRVGSKFMGFPC